MTDWNTVVPGDYTNIVPQVRNALALLEAASAGSGDVVGPSSVVNDRIAVFDGTTGKLIKDGGSTIAEIVAGSGGLVSSVFSRTGHVVAATDDYTWAQINKATSSLADITTRSASDLSSGTLPDGRFPATLPAASGANLTSLNASNLSSGTIPDGRFPATLPALSGANLTALNASNLASGTLPDARFPATLPAISGVNLTNLNATNIASGTLAVARGGTGTSTQFTAGSIVFADASGVYSQDNASLFWDDTNNRLGIGTNSPASNCDVHILKSSVLARLTVETSHISGYAQVGVKGTGREFQIGVGGASEVTYGVANKFFVYDATGDVMRLRLNSSGELEIPGSLFVSNATANLYLKDTSTGWQSASTTVITPQNNNAIRSTAYTSGLVGWNISALGNAEFNNVDVRGAIHAAIFTYNAINATAGTLGVFKSAAKLRTDVTVPSSPTYGTTTVNIDVVDADGLSHAASQLFIVNDILRLKDGLVGDTWFRVASVSDQTTFWRYVATIMAGSNNVTYRAGMGVPDYGISGQGFIIQTADQTNSPYLQMATHTAAFSSSDVNGTLTLTPRLRLGNLNGSYGYASDIYGFGTGEYGVASKAWVTVEQTNGIRMGSNTTARIQLNPDGSGFLANSSISWTTAGALTVTANATIAGWTVNATSISNSTTYFASGLDIPAGQVAWFGRQSGGSQGFMLRDAGGRFIDSLVGFSSIYPFIAINDATRFRIVLGGLNFAYGSDGSTDSMGMKIWSAAGTKLAEFSDVQNVISGWAIGSTKISSTGIDLHSGADAALAFGTTPPTSASVGTGIWLDRTGLYGLLSNAAQISIDSATGALNAGNTKLNASGVSLLAVTSGGKGSTALSSRVKWMPSGASDTVGELLAYRQSSTSTNTIELWGHGNTTTDTIGIVHIIASSDESENANRVNLRLFGDGPGTRGYVTIAGGSNFKGVTIGSNSVPATSAILDMSTSTGALLPPRLTTTERDALTPADGMILYNSTLATMQYRKAGAWVSI